MLDVALFVAVVLCGFLLRQRWVETSRREQALLRQIVPAGPPPAMSAAPVVNAIVAGNYMETVQLMLFSKDRNPNVILDPPPPPPPPPKMPDLPVAYGIMDLGGGPTIILAEKPGAPHRGYQAGETIGVFKIVSMDSREVLFDWEGQPVKRTLQELAEKKSTVAYNTGPEEAKPNAAAASTQTIGAAKGPLEEDMGNQTKACAPGDTTPAGTVEGGMRKVVTKSPFGDVCRWEPVR